MEKNYSSFKDSLPKIKQRLPRTRVKTDIPKIKIEENECLFEIRNN